MVFNVLIYPNATRLPIAFTILSFDEIFTAKWALNYFYQISTTLVGIVLYAAYLPTIVIFMNHSCWTVELTFLEVEKLDQKLKQHTASEKNPNSFEDDLKNIAKSCKYIIEWQNEAKIVLQSNFLLEFAVSSFVFCLSFQTMKVNVLESFYICLQLPVLLAQLFVYCYMGSRFKSRVEKLSSVLYDTEWHLMTVSQQKELLVNLRMTQNIKGFDGVFRSVDLATFQKVIDLTVCSFKADSFFFSDPGNFLLDDGAFQNKKLKMLKLLVHSLFYLKSLVNDYVYRNTLSTRCFTENKFLQ